MCRQVPYGSYALGLLTETTVRG